ncbi:MULTISPECIES: hypothetical protein [unclassified Microcoleus]|uniref:hypothetical protein n=1 Tax=unclassified Microcoleus TaxID=2642155 RepID=UPI002FD4CAF1
MTSQEFTLSEFKQFAPKAFLISLAKFEGTLAPELIAEVNEIGTALVGGDVKQTSQLIYVAQKDAAFYELFKQAHKELRQIDKTNEKNKYLAELDDNTPSRQATDDFNNFLAPPLTDANPQNAAKRLLGKASDLVERVYRLKF